MSDDCIDDVGITNDVSDVEIVEDTLSEVTVTEEAVTITASCDEITVSPSPDELFYVDIENEVVEVDITEEVVTVTTDCAQGIPGAPGVAAWDETFTYSVDDVIYYDGDFYVSLTSNLNSQPDSNPSDWTQITTSGGGGSAANVTREITQAAHGLSVGEIVYFDGTDYVLAQADDINTSEVVGVISTVEDVDTFTLLLNGHLTGLSGLTSGETYFLSETTPGALTATEPSASGEISKPLLIADSATSGYFFNWRGSSPDVGGGGAVDSVNSQTGVVQLNADDIPFDDTSSINISASEVQNAIDDLDNMIASQGMKAAVRIATFSNIFTTYPYTYDNGVSGVGATITMNSPGALTIELVPVALGDRVIFAGEPVTARNGVYVCTTEGTGAVAAVFTRATDADEGTDFPGSTYFVKAGSTNGTTQRILAYQGSLPPTIGSSNIVFKRIDHINAGSGILYTNNTVSADIEVMDKSLYMYGYSVAYDATGAPYIMMPINATAASRTITLPLISGLASDKTRIGILVFSQGAGNTVTVQPSSGDFLVRNGNADPIVLTELGQTIIFQAEVGSTRTWFVTGSYLNSPDDIPNGIPAGGTSDQVLAKTDGTNYNTYWKDDEGGVSIGDAIGSATARRLLSTDGSSNLTDTDFDVSDVSLFGGLVTGKLISNVNMSSSSLGFIDATGVGSNELLSFNANSGVAGSFAFVDVDTLNLYYQMIKDASNEFGLQLFAQGNQVDSNPAFMVTIDGMRLYSGATVDTIETVLTDDDTHIPTSGAVVDYVAGLGGGAVAASDVTYDNVSSELNAIDVQDAIDELAVIEPRDHLNMLKGLQDRTHYALVGGGNINQYDETGGFTIANGGDFADGGADVYVEYVPLWPGLNNDVNQWSFQEVFTIEDDLANGGDLIESAICWKGRNPIPFFEVTAADSATENPSLVYGEYPGQRYWYDEYNGEVFMLQRVRHTYDPSTGTMRLWRPAKRYEAVDETAFGNDWVIAHTFPHHNPGSHPLASVDPLKPLQIGKGSGKYLVSRVTVNAFDGTPYCDFFPQDNQVDENTVYDPILADNWTNADSLYAVIVESEDFALNMFTNSSLVESVNTQTGVVVLDPDDLDDTSTAHKFVTAGDVTNLGNLSGTNTGDQDLSDYFDKTSDDTDDITEGATNLFFTTTEQTKLSNIEALADVTDATNVDAAGAVMESDTTTAPMGFVIDEDDMVSDLDTKVPTQQSVKAYVDNATPPPTTVATVDTKANILALSPSQPQVAFATDSKEFYLWDGTNWQVASLKLSEESQNPDMGYGQDDDKLGYTATDITDKKLHNMILQGSVLNDKGGVRYDVTQEPNRLQLHSRGDWQTIYDDLTTEYGDFRHTPLGKQVYIWRGDSIQVGLNGRSMIQEYKTSMGAFPPPVLIDGGTF